MIGDNIRGDENANSLRGEEGADMLNGADGNDVIIGGADGDVMIGGGGNDVFRLFNEAGNEFVQDFDLNDNESIEFSGFGPGFDLADLTLSTVGCNDVLVEGTGWAGSILLEDATGQVDAGDFTFA